MGASAVWLKMYRLSEDSLKARVTSCIFSKQCQGKLFWSPSIPALRNVASSFWAIAGCSIHFIYHHLSTVNLLFSPQTPSSPSNACNSASRELLEAMSNSWKRKADAEGLQSMSWWMFRRIMSQTWYSNAPNTAVCLQHVLFKSKKCAVVPFWKCILTEGLQNFASICFHDIHGRVALFCFKRDYGSTTTETRGPRTVCSQKIFFCLFAADPKRFNHHVLIVSVYLLGSGAEIAETCRSHSSSRTSVNRKFWSWFSLH